MFQSRTGLLILFLSAATFIWGIPENKYELWGYIKSNKNVGKTPASWTMNLELCKFPRMYLTHFRLAQRQSATVTAHTCTLSWHSPFKYMWIILICSTTKIRSRCPFEKKNFKMFVSNIFFFVWSSLSSLLKWFVYTL